MIVLSTLNAYSESKVLDHNSLKIQFPGMAGPATRTGFTGVVSFYKLIILGFGSRLAPRYFLTAALKSIKDGRRFFFPVRPCL